MTTPRYSPAELSRALGLFEPTDEQAAVIWASIQRTKKRMAQKG